MPNTTRRCQIGRCPNYAQPDGRFCDYHAQDGTGIARHHATGIAPHLAPDLETARKIAHDFTFYPGTNAGGNRHFNPTTSYAIESELLLSLSRNRNSGYDPQNPQTSSDYPSYSYTPQGNVAIAPQPTPDPSTNEGMAEIFDPPTTNQNQPSSYGTSGHVLQSTSTSVGSSGNPVMNTGSSSYDYSHNPYAYSGPMSSSHSAAGTRSETGRHRHRDTGQSSSGPVQDTESAASSSAYTTTYAGPRTKYYDPVQDTGSTAGSSAHTTAHAGPQISYPTAGAYYQAGGSFHMGGDRRDTGQSSSGPVGDAESGEHHRRQGRHH